MLRLKLGWFSGKFSPTNGYIRHTWLHTTPMVTYDTHGTLTKRENYFLPVEYFMRFADSEVIRGLEIWQAHRQKSLHLHLS